MTWRDEFRTALFAYMLKHGILVKEHAGSGYGGYGGWTDYFILHDRPDDATSHITRCGIDTAASTYTDSEWYEFAGTFADDPWPRSTGIDAGLVCKCGKVARTWRYTDSYAALITSITEDPK